MKPQRVVWLLVVVASLCGYLLRARPQRMCPGLGAAGLAGLVIAAIGVTPAYIDRSQLHIEHEVVVS